MSDKCDQLQVGDTAIAQGRRVLISFVGPSLVMGVNEDDELESIAGPVSMFEKVEAEHD